MSAAVCVSVPRLSCWRKRERKRWLQGMMGVVEEDAAALKLSVLLLMLQHPEGVKFGDFSGAFQQLHGYPPKLSRHGYCSLKDLLAEMKKVVVLEGDSKNPVIKVASDLDLDQWLEKNGWDDCEEEAQSSLDDADAGNNDEGAGAEEATGVLDLLPSLLSIYEHGLRIEKIQEYLLARDRVDLAKLSITQGYTDTLEFLEQRMPGLTITYQKKRLKCVVRLAAGAARKLQPPVSISSYQKVLDTGLTLPLNCPPPPQDLFSALSQTAKKPEPSTEKNKTQNRTEPFLSTSHAIPQIKDLQLQELTATEKGDPATLKRNVLHLVLQHHKGVKFGDFSGAFQQLHGYPPKLSLHGYRSLRDLVAEMKDVVVLEGNSQNPVIKVVRGSHLYQWMEGGEKNRRGDSEGKAQNLSYDATAREDAAEVLELLTSLLSTYTSGLRIEKVQEFLLAQNRVDLETFSISQGYKDTLEFLEHQMPELTIQYRENRLKCVVQLTAGTAEKTQPPVSNSSSKTFQTNHPCTTLDSQNESPHRHTAGALELLTSLLSTYMSGLRIEKVQEFLLARNRVDLEMFSVAQGYKDTLEFLEHRMPELTIQYREDRLKCVVQLTAGTAEKMQPPASSSSCKKVLHNGLTFSSSCTSAHQGLPLNLPKIAQNPEPRTEKNNIQSPHPKPPPSTNHAIMQVKVLLRTYKFGLRIEKVQEFLLAQNKVDLETFSIAQGYKDTLEFLEHQMPELTIQYRENRLKCVVRSSAGTKKKKPPASSSSCKKVLHSGLTISSSCPPPLQDLPLESSKTTHNPQPGTEKKTQNRTEPPPGTNHAIPQDLLAEMKDIVVLEGESKSPVIKGASDLGLDQWLEENRWDDSEEETQNSLDDDEGGGAEEATEVLELITNLFSTYKPGLRIEKVQEFLLAQNGVDLEKFSIAQGYKDTLELLEHQMPELTIQYQENRLKCVAHLAAGKVQPPVSSSSCKKVLHSGLTVSSSCPPPLQDLPLDSLKTAQNLEPRTEMNTEQNRTDPPSSHAIPQLQELMTMEEGDPAALKRNVLHVVLRHPEGVKFGNFSGAFHQLHGYHPQFALHGYRSLRNLLADMKDVVVLEGDSQNPVIKIASGSLFYQWLVGEENGQGDSEGKAQSLSCEAAAGEDADVSSLPPSAIAPSLVEEPASQAPEFSIAFVAVRNVLKCHPKGLKIKKLQEALRETYHLDLERLRSGLGYKDIISFLKDMPGLLLRNSSSVRNCVVQLQSGPSSPAPSLDTDFSACNSNATFRETMRKESVGTQSPTPSLDTDFCAGNSNAIPESQMTKQSDPSVSTSAEVGAPLSFDSKESSIRSETSSQRRMEKKPTRAEILALISSLLSSKGYEMGLRVKKLQELLLSKEEVDLEKFSIAQGHKDSLAFLECHMPELKIRYEENRLSCVLHLGSDSCISASSQVSAPLSFDSEESSIKSELSTQRKVEKKPAALEAVLAALSGLLSTKGYVLGLRLKEVQKLLLSKKGINLEKFSIAQGYKDSLAFLECHMPELKISYQEDRLECLIQLGSGSCFSTSTQANTPPSFDSKQSSIKSETPNQRKMGKKPALEEVLALLSSLLSSKPYQSGLKLKKVQELLLTEEGFDLEKFSIAQGHKDSLAFVECHMPEHCLIRYQEDRLSCVLQLGSGFGSISKHLPTSRDCSANRPWIQSLPAPSTAITPVSQDPHGAILRRDESPSQLRSGISARLLSECQRRRTPPTEELPSLSDAQQFRRSNLTGPHHAKDQDELKQEVAHVLARHPEGVSLFQFRAEYSAAYQKHLPLGNASSAKQCLLQMPNVVCLKGYGVQTLLFPVSSKESSLKSGQPIMSRVEDAVVVPVHSVSKAVAMADPVLVFQPSLPTAPVRPGAPKPRALLPEHEMARARLGNPSGQPYLTNATEAAAAHGFSLSEADPVLVPKSSAPKATVAPVPPPRPFPHLYSECFKPLSNKETCPGPETSPRRPPETASPEEEQVKTSARPRGARVLPPSPVVFPSDWGEMSSGFPSTPTHPAKPWTSDKSIPAPSLSQPLPASFMTWAQPLVFPPVVFLNPLPPPSASVHNAFGIPPQNVYQSSVPQTVPQVRPVQPVSPLHWSAEQRNYVCVAQGPGAFSQEQMSSRTVLHAQSQAPVFAVDGLPVSPPSHNPSSSYAFRSQTIYHQTERCHHPWLDGPQCGSTTSAVHNSIMATPSARAPSQPAAYWNQSVGGNPFVTFPSTTLSSVPPAPTHVPQQPPYASSRISTRSDALASSDHCVSPHPLEPQTLSLNNRDPQAFVYTQRHTDVHSTISSVTTRSNSSPTSVSLPTQTSGQPSYTSYNSTVDYGAPNLDGNSLMATSKEAEKQDNHSVTWVDKQKPRLTQRPTESYLSPFQSSPPPKSPSKCVLL